jgi:hypothetical protein
MSKDNHWIVPIITKAREQYPQVTEAVGERTNQLLCGKLCEALLSAKELTDDSKELIADMLLKVQKSEAIQ